MAKQAEMGCYHPQRPHLEIQIDHERPARLDTGKLQLLHIGNRTFAQKQHVAVPAVSLGGETRNRNGYQVRLAP
ncbi:hypothetical protein D3C72_2175410 [compost metagenome]